ncbi:MAG: polysaccharide deacetylase [Desulfomicrobiaceae bacterium]|jgi:hypothetical protein|nr:polysaccharide deacetylase [Desulfomicrobiaceae bacterium]
MPKVYLFQKGGDDIKFKCIINYCINKENRRVVLERLIDRNIDILNIQKDFYINEQELRHMEETGMIIGGHTVNHNLLSSLDEHEQREEIINNIKTIEKILGHRIQWFCFPYGGAISYNETTIALLKEYGIQYCLSVEHRDVSTKDLALQFAIPRYDCTCFPYGKSYITKHI